LKWTTSTEINNSGFEIEKKYSYEWENIGFVKGNGTTTQVSSYSFTDDIIVQGKYFYRLKQLDFDGSFEYSDIIEISSQMPVEFFLEQNFPNPFNPSTAIKFSLPVDSRVKINIYNSLGEEIAKLVNKEMTAGSHQVNFSAENLTSGIYFYSLQVVGKFNSFSSVKKMILIK
jgi:hypothetical protein